MLPHPGAAVPIGINGVQVSNGYLYYSSGGGASIYRYRLPTSSVQVISNTTQPELVSYLENETFIDDFAVGVDGSRIWACSNVGNTLQEVNISDGSHRIVLGSLESLMVAGDTAAAFGRTVWDKHTLYVVTGGGLAAPVNGTVVEPAKVVAVNTGLFQ